MDEEIVEYEFRNYVSPPYLWKYQPIHDLLRTTNLDILAKKLHLKVPTSKKVIEKRLEEISRVTKFSYYRKKIQSFFYYQKKIESFSYYQKKIESFGLFRHDFYDLLSILGAEILRTKDLLKALTQFEMFAQEKELCFGEWNSAEAGLFFYYFFFIFYKPDLMVFSERHKEPLLNLFHYDNEFKFADYVVETPDDLSDLLTREKVLYYFPRGCDVARFFPQGPVLTRERLERIYAAVEELNRGKVPSSLLTRPLFPLKNTYYLNHMNSNTLRTLAYDKGRYGTTIDDELEIIEFEVEIGHFSKKKFNPLKVSGMDYLFSQLEKERIRFEFVYLPCQDIIPLSPPPKNDESAAFDIKFALYLYMNNDFSIYSLPNTVFSVSDDPQLFVLDENNPYLNIPRLIDPETKVPCYVFHLPVRTIEEGVNFLNRVLPNSSF